MSEELPTLDNFKEGGPETNEELTSRLVSLGNKIHNEIFEAQGVQPVAVQAAEGSKPKKVRSTPEKLQGMPGKIDVSELYELEDTQLQKPEFLVTSIQPIDGERSIAIGYSWATDGSNPLVTANRLLNGRKVGSTEIAGEKGSEHPRNFTLVELVTLEHYIDEIIKQRTIRSTQSLEDQVRAEELGEGGQNE